MAHSSKLFTERKVDIPNRSGFDLSHENLLTMKVGTLTPVLCEEVIPNETFSLKQMSQIQLPPMATDFYGRVDMRFEAFFVPNRILWAGWKNFWTMPTENPYGSSSAYSRPLTTPALDVVYDPNKNVLGRGTLADYLGFKQDVKTYASGYTYTIPNILPFVAYHKIYDEWYRNSKIQNPVFPQANSTASAQGVGGLPFNNGNYVSGTITFPDGVSIFDLRQRNWAKDYYTTASLYPQGATNPSTVTFSIPGGTETTNSSFTIPQLRSANVLQRWLERNNIAGERYADQIKAQYGILPSDAVVDRPIFLGSCKFGIYNKSIYQQSNDATNTTSNPFNTVGAKYATANGFGNDTLIDNFTATEHGYIIVIASIVPHAYYSTGTRRQMLHNKPGDFAMPLLQGVGDQKIYACELEGGTNATRTFGYTLENAEYKYHDDEVHGLLADGENLSAFTLQRSFDQDNNLATLNSDFVTIPENYLDQVTAVKGDMSKYGAWADIYFDFKRVSPLSEYVIPTLGDLKDTHKETIPLGGRML